MKHALLQSSVLCAIFLFCQAPMQAADVADPTGERADPQPMKAVENLFRVAEAARAAGYDRKWNDVNDLIRDLESGVTIQFPSAPVTFKIEPITAVEKVIAKRHILIGKENPGTPIWKHPANAVGADGSGWQQVNFEVDPVPTSNPCPLTIKADQAELESEKVGDGKWYGYGGPMNTHTRRLSFVANKESFDVPGAFVADLLNLKIDDSAHVSLDGENTVLIMRGSGGEKSFEVLFHFKGKRLAQRILEYSEARHVYIKENR